MALTKIKFERPLHNRIATPQELEKQCQKRQSDLLEILDSGHATDFDDFGTGDSTKEIDDLWDTMTFLNKRSPPSRPRNGSKLRDLIEYLNAVLEWCKSCQSKDEGQQGPDSNIPPEWSSLIAYKKLCKVLGIDQRTLKSRLLEGTTRESGKYRCEKSSPNARLIYVALNDFSAKERSQIE